MKSKAIEVIVRTVIVDRDKILLCRQKGSSHYFLPGGHIEFGETIIDAIRREIEEELGTIPRKPQFLGVVENRYRKEAEWSHEINFVYKVGLAKKGDRSLEDHIEFAWLKKEKLQKEKIWPLQLKKRLLVWIKSGKF